MSPRGRRLPSLYHLDPNALVGGVVLREQERLEEFEQLTLDGSGAGTVTFGPVPVGRVWYVERLVVSIAGGISANLNAEARLYHGPVRPENEIDNSVSGASDVAEYPNPVIVFENEQLNVVWSAGTADAQATAVVRGRDGLEEFLGFS